MSTRVGLVSLAEAGNFGDDLITVAVIQAITSACDEVEVCYMSSGHHLDWGALSERLGVRLAPYRLRSGRDLPGSRRNESLFIGCDMIVFGGGGLLQTTHHPHHPYFWINHLPRALPLAPVLAVGLGLGPISDRWEERLRTIGSPFDDCYLRDDDSLEYARTRLGWPANRCRDFVDAEFLAQFGVRSGVGRVEGERRTMGVAIRRWPGLDVRSLARHIDRIATVESVEHIQFFVLEARPDGPDLAFARAVAEALRSPSVSLRGYVGRELAEFAQEMAMSSVAISMKLHSSALWGAVGVPMYPIFYAPKTAAFFGKRFRGLEIFDHVVPLAPDGSFVPRAQDVVDRWIKEASLCSRKSSRNLLSPSHKLTLQVSSSAINIYRRLSRPLHSRC